MQTCNISRSPKEYTHLRLGREPNITKSVFFLGWMCPSKIQMSWIALSGLNSCMFGSWGSYWKRDSYSTCPFKTWYWETWTFVGKLETTTTKIFFNLQHFNSWEFGVSPRAVDDITNVGSHIPCILCCLRGVDDVIFSHKGKPQHPEGLNSGLGR